MVHVLHITAGLHKNGTEKVVMQIIRHSDKKHFRFSVLTFDASPGGYRPELEALGIPVWTLPLRREGLRAYRKALDRFFESHRGDFDAVHFHAGSLTTLAPLRAARDAGVKVRILHIHGSGCTGLHNRLFHRFNRRLVADAATAGIACSDLAARWGLPKCLPSEVVENGVETELFSFNSTVREKIRKELGLSPDTLAIVHAGTFNRIKNQKWLLPFFARLKMTVADSVLFLAGDGPLREETERTARNMGLAGAVHFLGRRDDIPALFQAMDVLLLPSLSEGCPFVVSEARAASLPAVVSDKAGVSDPGNGVQALPLSDPEGWVRAVVELTAVPRTPLGSQKAETLSVGRAIERINHIYTRLTSSLES